MLAFLGPELKREPRLTAPPGTHQRQQPIRAKQRSNLF
jgi:hypothetical protein